MKTKEKNTIEKLREIREKISAETQNMTFAELKKYIHVQLKKPLHPQAVWK